MEIILGDGTCFEAERLEKEAWLAYLYYTEHHGINMERVESVGFDMSRSVIDQVINCFADHGLEVVLDALDDCAGVQGNKLRYFNRVIENLGKQKPSRDDADRESEELDEIYRKTENMLRELEEG